MFRTQVYLTESERTGLRAVSESTGKSQSALIREAIDQLLRVYSRAVSESALDAAEGMWRDHDNLPDVRGLRKEWDRG